MSNLASLRLQVAALRKHIVKAINPLERKTTRQSTKQQKKAPQKKRDAPWEAILDMINKLEKELNTSPGESELTATPTQPSPTQPPIEIPTVPRAKRAQSLPPIGTFTGDKARHLLSNDEQSPSNSLRPPSCIAQSSDVRSIMPSPSLNEHLEITTSTLSQDGAPYPNSAQPIQNQIPTDSAHSTSSHTEQDTPESPVSITTPASPSVPPQDKALRSNVVESSQYMQTPTESAPSSPSTTEQDVPESPMSITTSAPTRFTLAHDDMGENLVLKLATFIEDPDFNNKISVDVNIGVSILQEDIKFDRPVYTAVQYTPGPVDARFSQLLVSEPGGEFEWPDFAQQYQKPTMMEMENHFEKLACEPPQEEIFYYGGNATSEYNSLLDPGKQLRQAKNLEVANETYWHIGGPCSGTVTHKEDFNFRSFNLTLAGYKLWILYKDQDQITKFIQQHWPGKHCDQFIRHQSLMIAPSRLREEGIEFEIYCAGPGDAVVTKPGQVHAVANFSPCVAISINFLLPNEKIISGKVCKDCGMFNWDGESQHKTIGHKRKADDPLQPKAKRLSRQDTAALVNTIKKIKEHDPLCSIPTDYESHSPEPHVLSMAAAVRSEHAIQQFIDIVKTWIDLRTNAIEGPSVFCSPFDPRSTDKNALADRIKQFNRASRSSAFFCFISRLNSIYFVKERELLLGWKLRANSQILDSICKQNNLTRPQAEAAQKEGNIWKDIHNGCKGILPFLFLDAHKNPFGIGKKDYKGLCAEDCKVLLSLLDDDITKTLCSIGQAFEECVTGGQDAYFKLNGEVISWDTLSVEKIRSLLPITASP